ncbi:hypothetical protein [Crateriforma spongiae]|uniref:hypothetical protein n=1 Tax=Crateriforma spongiae TaxID=2724528 RepID=UPI001447CF10|nr:hypothetical protein [Crateriforma spongiae]
MTKNLGALFVLGVCCASVATAQDETGAREEAQGYFDAVAIRMANFQEYDLLVRVDNSVVVNDVVAPVSTTRWRIRMDKGENFCCFVALEESVDPESAMVGKLDKMKLGWKATIVDGTELRTQIAGRGRGSQAYRDFDEALSQARCPNLSFIGTGDFLSTCLDSKRYRLRLGRAFGAATKLRVSSSPAEAQCNINVVFQNAKSIESHLWQFGLHSLSPERYITRMSRPGNRKTRVMFDQRLDWEKHSALGWVPVMCESTEEIRLKSEAEDGQRKYTLAKKLSDAQLYWKKPDNYTDLADFRKMEFSLAEIQKLVDAKE